LSKIGIVEIHLTHTFFNRMSLGQRETGMEWRKRKDSEREKERNGHESNMFNE